MNLTTFDLPRTPVEDSPRRARLVSRTTVRTLVRIVAVTLSGACVVLPMLASRAASKTANPNHEDATLAMAVHGEKLSEQLQDDSQSRYLLAAKALKVAIDKESKRQVNKIEPKAVGEAFAATQQLGRLAQHLQMLGEPAGLDFQRRSDSMSGHLTRIGQSYAGTPEGSAFLTKARVFINKTLPDRMNTIRRVAELLKREQYREAETTLYTTLDKLATITVFMSHEEQKVIYEPFADVRTLVDSARMALLGKEANEILAQRRKELTPAMDALLRRAAAFAPMPGQSPAFEGDGPADAEASKTGPDAVAAILSDWQQLHVRVQKFHALSLIVASRPSGAPGYAAMMSMGGAIPLDPLVQQYRETFPSSLSAALARIIELDAGRASESQVPLLHAQYLQALALSAARDGSSTLARSCAPALEKLAAKSAEYQGNVQAYQEATKEILRWRQRVASSQARGRLQTHVAVETPFRAAFTSREQYLGLFPQQMADYADPHLTQSAPDTLLPVLDQVIGKKVLINDIRGIGTGKNAVSLLTYRTYGTLRGVRNSVEPAIAALRADLFVTDTQAPLSLDAASALATAELGDWDYCGGTLQGLHLEGYLTRLATLPDAAWPMMPLGLVASQDQRSETTPSPLLARCVVRFEVVPDWVQHRYFLAEVPADSATAAR